MTHLRIELNTITENVTSDVIHKLYETAKAIIDAEEANDVQESLVSLKGNLLVSKAYGDEIDWLEAKFPDLHINVTVGRYIDFVDPNIKTQLLTVYGDGVGILPTDISTTYINKSFTSNTNITSFDELSLFTSVTSITSNQFKDCTNLTSIDTSRITYIDQTGLSHTGVTSLDLSSITSMGNNACSKNTHCTSITFNPNWPSTTFPSGLNECSAVTSFTLPSGVTTLSNYAFYKWTALSSIDTSNITSIGNYTFLDCTSLTNIDLSSCTTIGDNAFNGCTSLTNIGTDLSNTTYISWDNTFANCPITNDIIIQNHDFRNNNSTLAFVGTRIRSLVVRGGTWPNSRDFGGRTNGFRSILGNNPNLLYVDLSESLFTSHSDSGYTFVGSTSLKWVKYPSTLVTFGKSEFGGCTSLEAIVLPAGQVVGSIIAESSYGSYAELHTLWSSAATVPSKLRVYVPDALVNDYKQHYAWSEYTDLIKPMSELPDLQAMISST